MREVLKLGVNPEKCIYANPVKQEEHILVAKELGVKKMTFDSIEELHKIKKTFPQAECILRIAVENTTAVYNLSEKFGAFMEDVPKIL
jgi:ornithine decarboxylase